MQLLLNWLWQGTALTASVAAGMYACRRLNAATRERIWWMTLAAVGFMPIAQLMNQRAVGARTALFSISSISSKTSASATVEYAASPSDALISLAAFPDGWLESIFAAWAAGTALGLVRLAIALAHLRKVKRLAAPIARDRELRLPAWMALHDRGRPARLVVSAHVHRAAALGLKRPLIALAPETIARLTDGELDQVVIHEYAHIQRNDDLAVILQRVIAAVLCVHPAVWGIDRAITTEREVACDDWVVAHAGTAARYAACLVGLAAHPGSMRWTVSPGALLSRSELTTRVTRLLDRGRNTSVRRSIAALSVAVPAIGVLMLACAANPHITLREQPVERADRSTLQAAATGAASELSAEESGSSRQRSAAFGTHLGLASSSRVARAVRPQDRAGFTRARRGDVPDANLEPVDGSGAFAPSPLSATPWPVITEQLNVFSWSARALEPALDGRASTELARRSGEAQTEVTTDQSSWSAAADAGLAIGGEARAAGMNTMRFFSRFGRSVAGAF
jgi:beta-lactamase regulating signal transducer with metallopeptidase domain